MCPLPPVTWGALLQLFSWWFYARNLANCKGGPIVRPIISLGVLCAELRHCTGGPIVWPVISLVVLCAKSRHCTGGSIVWPIISMVVLCAKSCHWTGGPIVRPIILSVVLSETLPLHGRAYSLTNYFTGGSARNLAVCTGVPIAIPISLIVLRFLCVKLSR